MTKKTIPALAFFAILAAISACKCPNYLEMPALQIRFGEGGGFSGREMEYALLDSGQMFLRAGDSTKDWIPFGSASCKKGKKLFKKAADLHLADVQFQHPGNLYKFIEVRDGDKVNRIVWGDAKYPVDPEIAALFQMIDAYRMDLGGGPRFVPPVIREDKEE